ncbi:hypothetical protein U1Q18_011026 [Sarracenia purpurea var. burkii]
MSQDDNKDDHHDHDMVMPGFRFHPTEEELIEFYLRRKVEGKRFNVELITFLDLYRYDPWELPDCTAVEAELWGIYMGLTIVLEEGLAKCTYMLAFSTKTHTFACSCS